MSVENDTRDFAIAAAREAELELAAELGATPGEIAEALLIVAVEDLVRAYGIDGAQERLKLAMHNVEALVGIRKPLPARSNII